MVTMVTIEQVQEAAKAVLARDDDAEWKAKETRLRAAGKDEARIGKQRLLHERSAAFNRELASKVLALRPEALLLPGSHGGDLDKPLWQQAAASYFGLDAEVEWRRQRISRR